MLTVSAFADVSFIAGAASWKSSVANLSSLPASGNLAGDCRSAQDSGTSYCWNGSAWVAGGGSGGGIASINGNTTSAQVITSGTAGTNFSVSSSGGTTTLNLPIASATNTGKLSSTDWSTFNAKQDALTLPLSITNGGAGESMAMSTITTTGTINSLAPTTGLVLLTGASPTINGITAPSTNLQLILVFNGSGTLQLTNQSASATAANRLILPGATDIALASGQAITLFYETTNSRWRVTSSGAPTYKTGTVTGSGIVSNNGSTRGAVFVSPATADSNGVISTPVGSGYFQGDSFRSSGGLILANAQSFTLHSTTGAVIYLDSQQLYSNTGALSADWNGRSLYSEGGETSLNYNARTLYSGANGSSINWDAGTIYDGGGALSIDYVERNLTDNTGQSSIDWFNRILYDNASINRLQWSTSGVSINGLNYPTSDNSSGYVMTTDGFGNLSLQPPTGGGSVGGSSGSFQWNNSGAFDGTGYFSTDGTNITMNLSGGYFAFSPHTSDVISVDGSSRINVPAGSKSDGAVLSYYSSQPTWINTLIDSFGGTSIDYNNHLLINTSNVTMYNWQSGSFTDNSAVESINTISRSLKDSAGNVILNFNTVQTSAGLTTAGFNQNPSSNDVFAESTFSGNIGGTAYSISDIVYALKTYGLLAQ